MITYSLAAEVKDIALDLIPRNHEHLVGLPFEFIFRSKHQTRGGHIVLATAKIVTGLTAFLSKREEPEFYLITAAADEWLDMPLPKRYALVDHELTHCVGADEDGRLQTRGHDIEEFTCIIERHGAWKEDVEVFVRAARQLTLPVLAEEVTPA